MAEREFKIIGSPDLIQFDFNLSSASVEEISLAWGEGIVKVFGEAYWYGEDPDGGAIPLVWSWVDLLEFLGRSWPSLFLEEVYPINVNPVNPLLLRQALAVRWESLAREIVLEEDELIYKFESRHDFSRSMRGIDLPSLRMLRQGDLAWLCTDSEGRLVSLGDLRGIFEQVGEYLAGELAPSANERAQHACRIWRGRQEKVQAAFFGYRSGLSSDIINLLQGDEAPELFWEAQAADNYGDSEILAAARMSASIAGVDIQRKLLLRLKTLPWHSAEPLRRMTASYEEELVLDGRVPYEDGYCLARWLRGKLGVPVTSAVNPSSILEQWHVQLDAMKLDHCRIDAVACWGNNHGPAVLLNVGEGSRAVHPFGKRSTRAHEICHLLVDRDKVLPVAEVLGGLTPKFIEQRANAFAAELLVPQESIGEFIRHYSDVASAIGALVECFEVSPQLVGWQIRNSGLYQSLQPVERAYVNQITSDVDAG